MDLEDVRPVFVEQMNDLRGGVLDREVSHSPRDERLRSLECQGRSLPLMPAPHPNPLTH